MCMLCGDLSQIPNEVNAGVTVAQSLLAVPLLGWLTYQFRRVYTSIRSSTKKRRPEVSTKPLTPNTD